MDLCLERVSVQERALVLSGDSLAQTEQTLRELDSLQNQAQVSGSLLQRAQRITLSYAVYVEVYFTVVANLVQHCIPCFFCPVDWSV